MLKPLCLKGLAGLVFLLLASSSTAQLGLNCNSFSWVNPLPTSNTLYGIDFQGSDTIWVGGERQTLLCSIDGGQSWGLQQADFGNYTVRDIEFVDADTGIVAADLGNQGRVYRTTDGGQTWDQYNFGGFMGPCYDLQFLSHDTGFVATSYGTFKTTDAGQNWNILQSAVSGGSKVHFVNQDTGMVISGVYDIERTTNGGQTWTTTTLPNGSLQDFAFVDADTGYVFGGIGYWFKTTDAGFTWNSHPNPGIYGTPHTMAFKDSIGYATSVSGFNTYFYKSTDYGNTFTSIYSLAQHNVMYGIEFNTSNQGIAVGRYGSMFVTDDGGANVDRFPVGDLTSDYFYEVDFPTPDSGFAGGRGQAAFTSDGGQTWVPQSAPGSSSYNVLDFFDSQKGFMASSQGSAVRTTNGGATWTNANLGGTHLDCQYVNDSVIYVVGSYNVLRKSTNGGQSWSNKSFGTSGVNYYDLAFTDEMNGVAVGENGTLARTTDGGDNWTFPNTSTNLYLTEVYFSDSLHGFAGGDAGVYLRSTDAGASWTQSFAGYGADIEEFQFLDTLNGFMLLSDYGDNIYQTSDGGLNWNRIFYSNTSSTISGIHFFNRNQGIGVGFNGTILSYQIGLLTPFANDESICGGDSIVLNASNGPGFVWYDDPALTNAVGTGANFNPGLLTETDTFYVRAVNNGNSCFSDTVEVVVEVLPHPNLQAVPQDSFCTPVAVDLADAFTDLDSTNGAISYWLDSAGTQAVPNPNAVGSGGMYYIEKETGAGCRDQLPVELFIFQSPVLQIVPPDTVCAPNTVDLTLTFSDSASTVGQVEYYENTALTQPLLNPTAVDSSGWYYIVKTTPEGCSDLDSVEVVIETCVGLENAFAEGWEIWPNPTEGTMHLKFGGTLVNAMSWQIIDLQGREVKTGLLDQNELRQRVSIDLEDLHSGWYNLVLRSGEGQWHYPIVKK